MFFRLGVALRLLRLRAGLRQVDLARRAHIVSGTVGAFEQERARPRLDVLARLLEEMGADLLDLVAALELVQESAERIPARRVMSGFDGGLASRRQGLSAELRRRLEQLEREREQAG